MSARLSNLEVLIAEARARSVELEVSSVAGPEYDHRYLSVELSPLVAIRRTRSVVLDILMDLGVEADLDVLVQGTIWKQSNLQVYVKSQALQVGASAIYNEAGDEVESVLYVEDGDVLHPEFVNEMTVFLMYRDKHVLGQVTCDYRNGKADGSITNVWIHPDHTANLSVRYLGIIEEIGAVDFTVPVETGEDIEEQIPLGAATLESIDHDAPRLEPSSFLSQVQHLDPAPEEIETLDPVVVLTLLKLNLMRQYDYLEVGTGPVEYSGGGNRLLSSLADNGQYIFQPKDTLPPDIAAHTRIESPGSNLLTNSEFKTPTSTSNPVPQGYTLTAPPSVTTIPTLDTELEYGIFRCRCFGSGPYVGPKVVVLSHTNPVALASLDPVTFSVLARTEYLRDDSIINTLRIVISFRDSGDTELSQVIAEFDPRVIKGTNFAILPVTGTPPSGTASARVSVELESVEASDDIYLYVMAPQFEIGSIPTSRIIGPTAPTNRSVDVLKIPQKNNLEFRRGSMTLIFASDYDGRPIQDVCLFDTRSDAGLNGFALYHLTSGRFRFVVGGPATPKVLETNEEFELQAGIFCDVTVQWSTNYMEVRVNEEQKALDETALVLPQAFNSWIYFFQTAAGADRFNGEIASFEIRRDLIS